MGLLDVFKNKASQSAQAEADRLEALKKAARSLDIDVAIAAHENWKARLLAYLDGKSSEDLRPEVVACDDRCDLGKWIHGEGQASLGSDVAFVDLRATHKMFHYSASTIVTMAQTGRRNEARELLNSGFATLSERIKAKLRELKSH